DCLTFDGSNCKAPSHPTLSLIPSKSKRNCIFGGRKEKFFLEFLKSGKYSNKMRQEGVLQKMRAEIDGEVQYYLDMNGTAVHMNSLLDKPITLHKKGSQCLSCGKERSIFSQGFCYPCFFSS